MKKKIIFPLLSFLTLSSLFLLNCSQSGNMAENIRMPSIFGSNMVIQRDIAIPVWGMADPGGDVIVVFKDQEVTAKVNKDSTWKVELAAVEASKEPASMEVIGKDTIKFENVLVGEVWVCSGQSNMEMPLADWGKINDFEKEIAEADYPEIRLFSTEHTTNESPVFDVVTMHGWQECSPKTIERFSSVGYFFGRDIHKTQNVPIGLINTNWGGTLAEAWTSEEGLTELPEFSEAIAKMKENPYCEKEAIEEYNQQIENWINEISQADSGMTGSLKWFEKDVDISSWDTMSIPQNWELRALPGFDGVVWYRTEFEIPESWKGKEIKLNLGPIDDIDETWVNGQKVGSMLQWNVERHYVISPDIVQPGKNVIAIRIFDSSGSGGIYGQPEQLNLKVLQEEPISLAGVWHYKVSGDLSKFSNPPSRMFAPQHRPTVLYNSMLHPIIPFATRGVIWYQGESNAGRAFQYQKLFQALVKDWRNKWQQGDFPFYFVQLANYKKIVDEPIDDEWAELREAQYMALSLPNTGMAVTIDIGDADDIHPKNKQDVGSRLAKIARNKIYGEDIAYSGPIYESMKTEENKIRVNFKYAENGLVIAGDQQLKGFAIAGEDKKFVWADAEIDGQSVVVSSPEVEKPVAVRYAWAINPVCNLFNVDGLPASPFRTDSWKGITENNK